MAVLPYMKQLPKDFYSFNYPAATPADTIVPDVPIVSVTPISPPEYLSGGTYYGDTPPVSPSIGWMWLNPANNGLYLYTTPGVWTQIGTNW